MSNTLFDKRPQLTESLYTHTNPSLGPLKVDVSNNLSDAQTTTVLRESLRSKVNIAPISMFGSLLPMVAMLPFLVQQNVSTTRIGLWLLPYFVSLGYRAKKSQEIRTVLDQLDRGDLNKHERSLRVNSIITQTIVGSGIWIVGTSGTDDFILPFFTTMIILVFAFAVMANLFSDFRTFIFSVPVPLGQPIVYWAFQGGDGIAIAVSLAAAIVLMSLLVSRGSKVFRDSVLLRFEKDQALSEVEAARRKTQDALDVAKAVNESKAFFMAAASHDIKQPLHALGLLTDTLLMHELPDKVIDILKQQSRSIAHINNRFDHLLDFSRFEQGVFKAHPQTHFLTDLAAQLSEDYTTQAQAKDLKFELDLNDCVIRTDPELFERLVGNLLSNAIRYTETGSVRLSSEIDDQEVEISVSDTGPGIPKDKIEDIFVEFVRLDYGDRTGAGLGLAIASQISRALGTVVQVESELNVGTRFYFRLPISQSNSVAAL